MKTNQIEKISQSIADLVDVEVNAKISKLVNIYNDLKNELADDAFSIDNKQRISNILVKFESDSEFNDVLNRNKFTHLQACKIAFEKANVKYHEIQSNEYTYIQPFKPLDQEGYIYVDGYGLIELKNNCQLTNAIEFYKGML